MAHAPEATPEVTACAIHHYAEWRKRAREKLAGPSTMREKRWTQLFITGKTPDRQGEIATLMRS